MVHIRSIIIMVKLGMSMFTLPMVAGTKVKKWLTIKWATTIIIIITIMIMNNSNNMYKSKIINSNR